MKRIKSVENFLKVLDENNFVNLYYVANQETNVRESICFITNEDAEGQMAYLKKIKGGHYYIAKSIVYFGVNILKING